MQKINGHTVRGGWSRRYVEGTIKGKKFTIWSKDFFTTSLEQVRRTVKKIEAGKVELPTPVSTGNLYYLLEDQSLVAFK